MAYGRFLQPHHIAPESRDVVKLGIGMVSAMSALILGLIVSAVMSSYNQTERDVQQFAADILVFDAALRDMGPAGEPVRQSLHAFATLAIAGSWPTIHDADPGATDAAAERSLAAIGTALGQTVADDDTTLRAKTASQQAFSRLQQDRWKVTIETYSSVNPTLILILGVWLTLIFVSFGLFAPSNGVTLFFLLACSASIGCAIYVILELNDPFEGRIAISPDALERALTHMRTR